MSEPSPPPIHMERYYRLDDEYLADVANMEAAGWRVVAVRRAPDSTIVATYAYGAITPAAPEQPFSPAGSTPQLRYARIASRIAFAILLVLLAIFDLGVAINMEIIVHDSPSSLHPCADAASCASYDPTQIALDATQMTICVTPLPTTTPQAAGLTGVTLGGPVDAFSALFGCEGPSGAWYDVNFHGQIVNIEIGGSQDTSQQGLASSDGLDRVFSIAVYWYHSPLPSLATMRATIARFFPPHTISLGANTSISPTEYLYRSAPLAAMFSPSAFVNNAYQPVTPGTFTEVCDVASCTIEIGDWNEG